MHASDRDQVILNLLDVGGFLSFQELSNKLPVSPATLRRDLERLHQAGKLSRVHGGARLSNAARNATAQLLGVPFHANVNRARKEKAAIGRAAAAICRSGDAVIIDGGSTTLQMCPHLENLGLQVLTNSLHIAGILLQQPNTNVSIPGGMVFREQNIVLDPFEGVALRNFRASRMFMSCAAISHFGLMQSDIILMQAERQLLAIADELVVLADSEKFTAAAGYAVCELSRVATLITDIGLAPAHDDLIRSAGIQLIKVQM